MRINPVLDREEPQMPQEHYTGNNPTAVITDDVDPITEPTADALERLLKELRKAERDVLRKEEAVERAISAREAADGEVVAIKTRLRMLLEESV